MIEMDYLVPWYDVSWDVLDEALADLGATRQAPEHGVQLSWRLGDTQVHLIEEDVHQLVVEGGADRVDLTRRLRERIRCYRPEDMPGVFDDDVHEFGQKLAILGAVAPADPDPVLIELFRRGLTHDDPYQREGAVHAAAIPSWPEVRADIERMAAEDPDDDVRRAATVALDSFA
jgi:hypothetical protein